MAVALLAGAFLHAAIFAGEVRAATSPLPDAASRADAQQGLEHLYHARFEEARAAFSSISSRHPDHPAGAFFLGGLEWHAITTGPSELIGSAAKDSLFFAHMDHAIELGEARVKKNANDVSARFFLGGAYGYEARYLALQEKWWDAYQKGKRGVSHLERVVKDDPAFEDAYLGLGIYHYYADVIPSVLKFFSTFVGMNGDKKRGLAEIHRALLRGTMVNQESRFFLAEIYTSFEEDHWRALDFSRSLRDEYPENELFAWLNARVLDEIHLDDLARQEWEWLRGRAQGSSQRGFVEYRLARTILESGDFAAAEAKFRELVEHRSLGSRRMTMWAHLRRGMALDFLDRRPEAIEAYRAALQIDASTIARERAEERLAASKKAHRATSLRELEELARIVKASPLHGEPSLVKLEKELLQPEWGLSGANARPYTQIARDIAEARLVRGNARGCIAAIDRLLAAGRSLPKEQRAELLRVKARALARTGDTKAALEELKTARPKADWETREAIDRDRRLIAAREQVSSPAAANSRDAGSSAGNRANTGGAGSPSSSPAANSGRVISTPDLGELQMELEIEELGVRRRIPLALEKGRWTTVLDSSADSLRCRFLADDFRRRLDPTAPRVILVGDEAWGVYPKQTKSPSPKAAPSR